MRTVIAICIVAVCLGANACSDGDTPAISASLSLRAEAGAAPADLAQVEKIVSARLKGFLPNRDSTLTSMVVGESIRFQFYGTPPDEHIAMFLATSRGELRIFRPDIPSEVWVSDEDVEDASLFSTSNGPLMELQLNEDAGQRLLERTRKNIGHLLSVSWDNKTLVNAKIRTPFGEIFQFNAPPPPEGLMMRVILQHGHLPVAIAKAEYRHGT